MKLRRCFAALFAALILIPLFVISASANGIASITGDVLEEKMLDREFTSDTGYKLNYRMYYSPTYSPANGDRPAMLIIYFHGDGGKGDDNTSHLYEKGLLNQLVSDDADGRYTDFQYIVVAPQCPEGEQFVDLDNSNNGENCTELMQAVEQLIGEMEATEILFEKFLVAGIGSGSAAAFDYASRNTVKTSRLLTVGGDCIPSKAASTYDAGVDYLIFAEKDNSSLTELSYKISLLTDIDTPVIFHDGDFNACLDYALSYTEPIVSDWVVKDTYTSRSFKITASCNEDGGQISATPSGVTYGGSSTVLLILKKGYTITSVKQGGVDIGIDSFIQSTSNTLQYRYVVENVQADTSIVVELTKVSVESTHGGVIAKLVLVLSVTAIVLVVAAAAVAVWTFVADKRKLK